MRIHARYAGNAENAGLLRDMRAIREEARRQALLFTAGFRRRLDHHTRARRERAHRRGFEDGYREGLTEAQRTHLQSQHVFQDAWEKARKECVELAIALAREVIGHEAVLPHGYLPEKLSELLGTGVSAPVTFVEVSPDRVEEIGAEMKSRFEGRPIEVRADPSMDPGNARVVTASGSVELRWEDHLQLLVQQLL